MTAEEKQARLAALQQQAQELESQRQLLVAQLPEGVIWHFRANIYMDPVHRPLERMITKLNGDYIQLVTDYLRFALEVGIQSLESDEPPFIIPGSTQLEMCQLVDAGMDHFINGMPGPSVNWLMKVFHLPSYNSWTEKLGD